MAGTDVKPDNPDESFPSDVVFPMQELNLLTKEDDDEGALQAIATFSCAFRHPARVAHIYGMAAAAEKAGFHASSEAFKQAVEVLPNAPEPIVRCAFISQLIPLARAWDKDGGAQGHAEVLKLMQTALDSLEDDVEEVTSAGQAAVLGIVRLLAPEELQPHMLASLDALERHPDDEVRCILAELVATLAADAESVPAEADLLPRLLRLATDTAYLVRKEVVFGLPRLAPRLPQEEVNSQLMPAFRKLAADRVWLVRAAAASALPAIAGLLPEGEARAGLVDLWDDLAGDTSRWVVSSALTALGPFLAQLPADSLSDGLLQQLHKAVQRGTAGTDCLMAAAGALPAVAEAVGAPRWAAVKPVLSALAASADKEVLHCLARDLPRLARALGPDRAASDWLPALKEIQRHGGAEALAGLAPQLAQFAELLPPERRGDVLQPLVAVLRGSASWRVRTELTGQLSQLARSSLAQVVEQSLVPSAVQLCQDPVAAVRHAAAAECAAMAAHLFSLVVAPTGPSGLTGTASSAGSAPAEPSASLSRPEAAAEAASASTADHQVLPPAVGERGDTREWDHALPSSGSARAGAPGEADRDRWREVLESLLQQLKCGLARSRSFRSRHSFVLVCQHILGMQAVDLFQQELLPELLKLAQDPVVDVRLALCRLLLHDEGPLNSLGSAVSALREHSPQAKSRAAAGAASCQTDSSKGSGACEAASSSGLPSTAEDQHWSADKSEQRNVVCASRHCSASHGSPEEVDECQISGREGHSSGDQRASAIKANTCDYSDMTGWLVRLKFPGVRQALESLAKDANPQVSLLAERGM